MRRALLRSTCFAALAVLGLAGCEVGPDFSKPVSPPVGRYDNAADRTADLIAADNDRTVDGAQRLAQDKDIPADWWTLFKNPALNAMMAAALANNPDLAQARATLRQAVDNLNAQRTALFPTVTASYSYQREKLAGASFGGFTPSLIFSLNNASVGVNYAVDAFGGTRREIEEIAAQADLQRFQAEAAYLSLTSNLATAAIQSASARGQIDATQQIVTDQDRIVKLLRARFEAGAVPKSQVEVQIANAESTRATLPALEHFLVTERHMLADLAGEMPQEADTTPITLDQLTLPDTVPLSVPSKLVEQRPDIRAAEANLHAASAAIGVAVSNRLPQITLSGDLGSEAMTIGKLFTPGGGLWSYGASAAQTLFDAGALADREDAARDAYVAAAAQYRSTVLAAFQNVADALHALQSDAAVLKARQAGDGAAEESLRLAKVQLEAGSITPVEVLTVEQTEQQAKVALVQAEAQRYADTVALIAALGGGWWNRADLGTDAPTGANEDFTAVDWPAHLGVEP